MSNLLRNAPFRYLPVYGSNQGVFGANAGSGDDANALAGQFDSVQLPIPSRDVEGWTGSGKFTEPVRGVIQQMSATYMMGGFDERLYLGLHNDDAQFIVMEYLRPVGGHAKGAPWRVIEHAMTGPLQDFDMGAMTQGNINRTTIPQDVLQYVAKGRLAGTAVTQQVELRRVNLLEGVNRVLAIRYDKRTVEYARLGVGDLCYYDLDDGVEHPIE